MPMILVIGLGGFLGAIARYGLSSLVPHRPGEAFPLATLLVDVLGCFLLGLAMAWLQRHPGIEASTRLFVSAGLLASFTTFSTLAFEVVTLVEGDRLGGALACLAANLLLGLAAIVAGAACLPRLAA